MNEKQRGMSFLYHNQYLRSTDAEACTATLQL